MFKNHSWQYELMNLDGNEVKILELRTNQVQCKDISNLIMKNKK